MVISKVLKDFGTAADKLRSDLGLIWLAQKMVHGYRLKIPLKLFFILNSMALCFKHTHMFELGEL